MNLFDVQKLHAGGPGSGCQGDNCGRKKSSTGAVFKAPDKLHERLFKKYGVRVKEYDPNKLVPSENHQSKARVMKYVRDFENNRPVDMLNIEKFHGKDQVQDGHHRWLAARLTKNKVIGFEVPARVRDKFYSELYPEK